MVLVRQIREDTCSAVDVADLVGGVEGGAPVVAGGGVVVVVEAVPPDRLGKGGGQRVQAGFGRLVTAGLFPEFQRDDRGEYLLDEIPLTTEAIAGVNLLPEEISHLLRVALEHGDLHSMV